MMICCVLDGVVSGFHVHADYEYNSAVSEVMLQLGCFEALQVGVTTKIRKLYTYIYIYIKVSRVLPKTSQTVGGVSSLLPL